MKKTKTTTRKRRTRKEDPRGIVVVDERYRQSNDPAQLKLLTKIQVKLRQLGSRHNVVPSLKLVLEIENLERYRAEHLKHAEILAEGIQMAEKSKLYKRLKAEFEAAKVEDAFKFT